MLLKKIICYYRHGVLVWGAEMIDDDGYFNSTQLNCNDR